MNIILAIPRNSDMLFENFKFYLNLVQNLLWDCQNFTGEKFSQLAVPLLTPVAGRIFETKNRAVFLERFFGRGIFAQNSFLGQKMSLDFK